MGEQTSVLDFAAFGSTLSMRSWFKCGVDVSCFGKVRVGGDMFYRDHLFPIRAPTSPASAQ